MGVVLAKKTLLAIEQALRKDQGLKFRSLLRKNINACDDAFDDEEGDRFRSHLGASMIGRDCPRQLWYAFRWFKHINHMGKTIRLFNRGHLEEGRFVTLLEMIDCTVWQVDNNGNQYRIYGHHKHFGSAIDGVVKGCPDVPDRPILAEFKTSNTKNFKKMEQEGCRESKPEHFIQQQIYMGKFKLTHSLYLMICKETDELYGEIIEFRPEVYEQYEERAGRIIFSNTPPKGIANSPGAWFCKFCDYKDICHNGEEVKERNCRTCVFSEPSTDPEGNQGGWHCRWHGKAIDKKEQLKGCIEWQLIPGVCQEC